MIDFNQVDTPLDITREFILSKLSEEQIFYYYFGNFQLGKVYPSKLRKDGNPSTGFYINKTGHIIYNDLSTAKKHNCFTFVAELLNLTHREALHKIAQDFGLIGGVSNSIAQKIINEGIEFDRELKKDTLIQFIPRPWNKTDLAYWNGYELDIEDLKREEVYPVYKLFLNKNEIRNLDELCFAYVVKERVKGQKEPKVYIKIYSPYSQTMKWLSNVPITVPFGFYDLKYGSDSVEVTKAKKDCMVLRKLFPSVIGTQNESTSALTDGMVKHLCHNFPKRTIIWDSDQTGVENCKKFNMRGFGYFNTPKQLLERDIKDVSDYVKAFGLKALESLLRQKGIL